MNTTRNNNAYSWRKITAFFGNMQKFLYFCTRMRKNTSIFLVLSLLLLILSVVDLCSGAIWISPWKLQGLNEMHAQILMQLRLPKMITAILAGASLSVAGLLMQTLFRNPLAGPYILGVSSGASLGVAFATLCASVFGGVAIAGHGSTVSAAIIGSMVVLLLVMAIAKRVKSNVTLLIVGMMLGNIATALVNVLQNFANPDSLKLFIVWTLGTLNGVGWKELPILLGILLVGALLVLLLVKPLNGLLLGEDYARSLGVEVQRTRWMIVMATGLLAGGITAFCGPIAFIGMAVPHIARGILKSSNHRRTVPMTALIGANLLLICDILCNLGTYPLPISTISALFGAPIMIWIILRPAGQKSL